MELQFWTVVILRTRNLAKYKFLKLPKYATVVSKRVGVKIVSRENTVIYICALIGWKMHDTCIKIVFR
jgi:hypothetical protein